MRVGRVREALRWFPEAVSDLAHLRDFIRVHNPDAAQRAAKRIRDSAYRLLKFPFVGIPVQDIDKPQLRDLFIPFGQAVYWMRYAVTDDKIIIISLLKPDRRRDKIMTL
jgi:plasmid stabilization system protein ParE